MKRKLVSLLVVVIVVLLVYLLCRVIWPGWPEPTFPDSVNQQQVAAITTGLSEAEILGGVVNKIPEKVVLEIPAYIRRDQQ